MKTVLAVVLLLVSASALADQYVQPYVRKDGTYVEGYIHAQFASHKYQPAIEESRKLIMRRIDKMPNITATGA